MKKRLIGAMSIACLLSMVFMVPASFASSGPDVVKMKNGKKAVTFPHKKHADSFVKGKQGNAKFKYTDDFTCGACHHKSHKGDTPKKCVSCKDQKKIKLKKFMHTNCKDGCHKKSGNKKLTKCKTCHSKK